MVWPDLVSECVWTCCCKKKKQKNERMKRRTAVKNSDSLLKFRYLLCGWLCAGDLVEAPFINVTCILLSRCCRSSRCWFWFFSIHSPGVRWFVRFGSEMYWTSCLSVPRDERAQWVFNISFCISFALDFVDGQMICFVANAAQIKPTIAIVFDTHWFHGLKWFSILKQERFSSSLNKYKSMQCAVKYTVSSRCIY